MAEVRAHVYISGLVQGVMFRETMRRQAQALGVSGWVRNLLDGRVEAVVQGEGAAVQTLLQWCHRGPSRAEVDHVEVQWETPQPGTHGFEVRHGWI